MTFEEDFPRFRQRARYAPEEGHMEEDIFGDWINIFDIQTCCLDKEKVREAKNKVEKIIYNVRSLLKDTNLKYAQDIDGKVWEAHEMLWDAVEKLDELGLDK